MFVMSVHLLFCLNVWTRLLLDWFLFILILETFIKICGKNPNFVQTRKKYWGFLSDDLSRFSCCQHNKITTEALLTATYVGTYCCCISIAMSTILICNMHVNSTKRTHCCWRSYLPIGRLYRHNQKWKKIFYMILKEISILDAYIMYPPSLTSALSVSNTFCPLISRWITLLECK